MQTTSLQSLHLLPPFSGNFTFPKRLPNRRNRASIPIMAMRRDEKSEKDRHDHKLVDENMIVLKMRIREITTNEQENRGASSPDHWMGWEKEWHKNGYDYDVYELVAFLQNLLMNTRPSLALGVVALLILSVSTPLALVLSYVLNINAM